MKINWSLIICVAWTAYFFDGLVSNVGEMSGPYLMDWHDPFWLTGLCVIFPMYLGYCVGRESGHREKP